MTTLRAIVFKLFGLFVDDGSLAVGLIVWICLCTYGLPSLSLSSSLQMCVWILGLAIILLENVIRTVRRKV